MDMNKDKREQYTNNRWKRDSSEETQKPFYNTTARRGERSNPRFSSLKNQDNQFLSKGLEKNSRWKDEEGKTRYRPFHTKDRRQRVRQGRSNFPFNKIDKQKKNIFKMKDSDFPSFGKNTMNLKKSESQQNWREAALRGAQAPSPPKSKKAANDNQEWKKRMVDDEEEDINWSDYEKEDDPDANSIDKYDLEEYDPSAIDSNDER